MCNRAIATAVLALRIGIVHEQLRLAGRKAARSVIYSAVVGDEIWKLDHSSTLEPLLTTHVSLSLG